MKIADLNPFLRYAELQPSVLSSAPLSAAYDYRIFYILSKKTHLVMQNEKLTLSDGDLVFLRPATPYYFEEKVQTIVLNFDLTRAHSHIKTPLQPSHTDCFDEKSVIENDPPFELSQPIHIKRAFTFEAILRECIFYHSFPSELSDAMASAALKRLICMIIESVNNKSDSPSESIEVLAKSVMIYLKNNYFNPSLTLETLSAEFGYHPYYLNKVFKDKMGITIHKALIGERMDIAKRLLTTTKLSVNEIAEEIGFGDRSQFCTAFKRLFRTTPLQYRKSFL